MLFNPDKFEHIRITNKRNIIQTSYNIHGHTLKETTQAKYPGVTNDNKLSWNSHVDQVTKRANQTTDFLRRNLSSCSKDVKAQCYKSLVCPQGKKKKVVFQVPCQKKTGSVGRLFFFFFFFFLANSTNQFFSTFLLK